MRLNIAHTRLRLPALPAMSAALALLVQISPAAMLDTPGTCTPPPSLAREFARDFILGVAVSPRDINNSASAGLVARHFFSVTTENALKWSAVQPLEGTFTFDQADKIVDFARRHHLDVVGHTLVWHRQVPDWVFVGPDGKPAPRDLVLNRMRKHIHTVMNRYRDAIRTWDVVNEAVADNPAEGLLRRSPWLETVGPDYISKAFEYAREAAPEAVLRYNDYGFEGGEKGLRGLELVRGFRRAGTPVDAIGLQCHLSLFRPSPGELNARIRAFAAEGYPVHITELDVSPTVGIPGPPPDSFRDGLPPSLLQAQAARYTDLFRVFLKNSDVIPRVTFWNVHDGRTWLAQWPTPNRRDYPLLWDDRLQPKPAFHAVIQLIRSPLRPRPAPRDTNAAISPWR